MKSVRILFAALLVSFVLTPALSHAQPPASAEKPQATAPEPSEPVAAEAAATHEEEGSGSMPQLDPTYYISQLFWLAIMSIVLYNVLAKVALPGVAKMVETRDKQVRDDLATAYKLKQEAEDLKIAYSRALRDSDEKAKTMTEKTIRDLRDKQTKGLAAANDRIGVKITEAEKQLRSEKDALVKESEIISERLAKSVLQELAKGRAA